MQNSHARLQTLPQNLSNIRFVIYVLAFLIMTVPVTALWYFYQQSTKEFSEQFFSALVSGTEMTASIIDPEKHARFVAEQDLASAEYQEMMDLLVDIHLSSEVFYYINTLIIRDNKTFIILDTAQQLEKTPRGHEMIPSDVMEEYEEYEAEDFEMMDAIKNNKSYVFKEPYTDEFGTFVGVCSPVKKIAGADPTMLCIDAYADVLPKRLDELEFQFQIASAISILFGLIISFLLLRDQHYLRVSMDMLREQRDKFEHISLTDPLTGAANRRAFIESYGKVQNDYKRYGLKNALIAIDVDHFKKVNDNYGHDGGDKVLIEMVKALSEEIRDTDIFARLGGEEFMVLSRYGNEDDNVILGLAERLRKKAASILVMSDKGEEISFTISVGVYLTKPDDDIDTAMKQADEALYSAKTNGRNRVEVYSKQ